MRSRESSDLRYLPGAFYLKYFLFRKIYLYLSPTILIIIDHGEIMDKPKYIDPTSDFGFKRIFASEPNKDLLIAFINELFHGLRQLPVLSLKLSFKPFNSLFYQWNIKIN